MKKYSITNIRNMEVGSGHIVEKGYYKGLFKIKFPKRNVQYWQISDAMLNFKIFLIK